MSASAISNIASAKIAVVEVLNVGGKKARFATEVLAGLRRHNVAKDEMDRALAEMEAEGTLVVRENFCADPHLAEVDEIPRPKHGVDNPHQVRARLDRHPARAGPEPRKRYRRDRPRRSGVQHIDHLESGRRGQGDVQGVADVLRRGVHRRRRDQ